MNKETKKVAYLVLGPESSGTRLMTSILINAGCSGSADHEQPFDKKIEGDLIVWRRSFPHNGKWPKIRLLLKQLGGYSVTIVVMVRDWYYLISSQVAGGHTQTAIEANDNAATAYVEIFSQLKNIPFIVVSYESLILNGEKAQINMLNELGLPIPETFVSIVNGDSKYNIDHSNSGIVLRSSVIKAKDFHTAWFNARCEELRERNDIFQRKIWEYAVIAELSKQIDINNALGFGVGKEPLACWFASQRINAVATDFPGIQKEWIDRHAEVKRDLYREDVCSYDEFERLVTFSQVDMNQIPNTLQGFDFVWSCGSFEHLGSIERGIQFFLNSMKCLRPGGLAVHTTEYNFGSNDKTIEESDLVLFRERDLRELEDRLAAQGDRLWTLDLQRGNEPEDVYVDSPPYKHSPHLALRIVDHVTTSIVLVAERGYKS